MDNSGQTSLSPGDRSPGQRSQYSVEVRNREQQMRRQRDEALKHCGDMLRALQQVSQAVGEAGNLPLGAEGQSLPQGNDFKWYRDNADYYQFNREPRLSCPKYGEIRGDDLVRIFRTATISQS